MLSCTGNPQLQTPNLDRLARTGARFERAYCGNPVCVPSRFCMLSGTMPSRIGMETNGEIGNAVPQKIFDNTMGTVFRRAGYQTVYGGKTHVPGGGAKRVIERYGFDSLTADSTARSFAFDLPSGEWREVRVEIAASGPLGVLRLYWPATEKPLEFDWIELRSKATNAKPQRWDFNED
jgi:arylsulfatase A-like enzyme